MVVSKEHNCVFVSNPKSGTHSLYFVLMNRYKFVRYRNFHNTRLPKLHDPYVFTAVRNPYTRAVSAWAHAILREPNRYPVLGNIRSTKFVDFAQWLTSAHLIYKGRRSFAQTQYSRVANLHLNKFIKIENVNQEFESLPFVDEKIIFPKINTSHIDPGDILNDESADLIRLWAADDFKHFDYSLDWRDAI